MASSFIQCSHSHKILIFLSYYIHFYVFQLVCQYDDIPLASLIYCKRTFFPMCRMSWNVNTLVYFYLAVCTSVFILSWNSYPSASQVIFSSYGNLAKLLNYRQLWIYFFKFLVLNATFNNISAKSWRPVLVVEEAGVPGENHRPWASNW